MPPREKFANIAYLSVTESAANTLTFSKLETGISIYEKVGWLIHRIEYYLTISAAYFAADADQMTYGLSASDGLSAVTQGQSAVIDYNNLKRVDFGTAAEGKLIEQVRIKDMSTIAGGGLLVPPNPIYIFVVGSNAPLAFVISARLFYTVYPLKADEFWELVEMRRMIGT